MNIAKISTQNSSFGIKLDGFTANKIEETKQKLEKEANGREFYYPLDIFEKSGAVIKEICPDKKLETEEPRTFSTKYVVSDEDNKPKAEFAIKGNDPCFAELATKLKDLHEKKLI